MYIGPWQEYHMNKAGIGLGAAASASSQQQQQQKLQQQGGGGNSLSAAQLTERDKLIANIQQTLTSCLDPASAALALKNINPLLEGSSGTVATVADKASAPLSNDRRHNHFHYHYKHQQKGFGGYNSNQSILRQTLQQEENSPNPNYSHHGGHSNSLWGDDVSSSSSSSIVISDHRHQRQQHADVGVNIGGIGTAAPPPPLSARVLEGGGVALSQAAPLSGRTSFSEPIVGSRVGLHSKYSSSSSFRSEQQAVTASPVGSFSSGGGGNTPRHGQGGYFQSQYSKFMTSGEISRQRQHQQEHHQQQHQQQSGYSSESVARLLSQDRSYRQKKQQEAEKAARLQELETASLLAMGRDGHGGLKKLAQYWNWSNVECPRLAVAPEKGSGSGSGTGTVASEKQVAKVRQMQAMYMQHLMVQEEESQPQGAHGLVTLDLTGKTQQQRRLVPAAAAAAAAPVGPNNTTNNSRSQLLLAQEFDLSAEEVSAVSKYFHARDLDRRELSTAECEQQQCGHQAGIGQGQGGQEQTSWKGHDNFVVVATGDRNSNNNSNSNSHSDLQQHRVVSPKLKEVSPRGTQLQDQDDQREREEERLQQCNNSISVTNPNPNPNGVVTATDSYHHSRSPTGISTITTLSPGATTTMVRVTLAATNYSYADALVVDERLLRAAGNPCPRSGRSPDRQHQQQQRGAMAGTGSIIPTSPISTPLHHGAIGSIDSTVVSRQQRRGGLNDTFALTPSPPPLRKHGGGGASVSRSGSRQQGFGGASTMGSDLFACFSDSRASTAEGAGGSSSCGGGADALDSLLQWSSALDVENIDNW